MATKQDPRKLEATLLANLKRERPRLEELLADVESHRALEDGCYRFYHGAFKAFRVQQLTLAMLEALRGLLPGRELNPVFLEIIRQGAGPTFEPEHNRRWPTVTRPILEACFHAHYFLALACRNGRELEAPPSVLPSGWAAVLYLYNLR